MSKRSKKRPLDFLTPWYTDLLEFLRACEEDIGVNRLPPTGKPSVDERDFEEMLWGVARGDPRGASTEMARPN